MKTRGLAGALALILTVAAPSAAAPGDAALTHYLGAQVALAGGHRDAASVALAALAAASTSGTVATRARAASKATDLGAIRLLFRDISMEATQWPLPDGVAIFYCEATMEGHGAFWVQRAGPVANPYDPASGCGAETAVGRLAQESSVVGYVDTYGRPDSYSATRLDAPLLDIPLAVTAITRDLMSDQNTLDVNDAVRTTSTATPITGFSIRPNFYIVRGFYVLNYRDGVRTLLDGSAPINAAGLEGIEVLRGPSSILYGKGEPGGLVNFTSKRPVAAWGGSVDLNAGSEGLMRGDLDLTAPLGGSGAGRLIVSGYDANSHRDSVESGAFYVNPSASFRLGPRTSIWLTSEYIRHNLVPDFGVLISPTGTVPAYFTRSRYMGDGALAKTRTTSLRFAGEADVRVTPRWDLRLVAGAESSDTREQVSFINLVDGGTTGYLGLIPPSTLLRLKYDESPHRGYDYGRVENVFRFAHGSGSARTVHQLLATADYRRDREEGDTTVGDYDLLNYADGTTSTLLLGFIPFGQGMVYNYHAETDAIQDDIGIAAQDLIAIGDRVNVLAGLRFESNRIDTSRTGTEQTTAVLGGPIVSLDSAPARSTTNSLAPRLGVVVKPTARLSLYASYLTAFISPVPGLLTQAGDLLTPEHSRQFEGGVKAALRRDRVFLTVSTYKTIKDDAFVFYQGYAENAGREESSGAELELMGAVTPEVSVVAGYTFTDLEFTRASPDLLGKTRPGLPRHVFSSWVQYEPRLGRARGMAFGAGLTTTSQVFASYPNTASLDGYAVINAMAGYQRGPWRFQVNAANLASALGYSPSGGFFAGGDPNVNPMSAVPIAPLRVTTHVSYRFR